MAINALNNLGVGQQIWKGPLVGTTADLRSLSAGAGITSAYSGTNLEITTSVNQAYAFAWTNTHTHSKVAGTMPATDMQVNSPGNGALVNANETLTTGYSTALDVRRTTNLATDGAFGPLGGIAALYVQHKVAVAAAPMHKEIGQSARQWRRRRLLIRAARTSKMTR